MTINEQWKEDNNIVVGDGYVKGTIDSSDSSRKLLVGNTYFVSNIPARSLIKGFTIIYSGNDEEVQFELSIGYNDCVKCKKEFSGKVVDNNLVICDKLCECRIFDDDSIVAIKLNQSITDGKLVILSNIINLDNQICRVQPYELELITLEVGPCTELNCKG